MVRKDLLDARTAWIDEAKTAKEKQQRGQSDYLSYEDHAGRVFDFHALRHLFITSLARNNVSPKKAQELARHGDINLTMKVYTHVGLYDLDEAVQTLPALPQQLDKQAGAAG